MQLRSQRKGSPKEIRRELREQKFIELLLTLLYGSMLLCFVMFIIYILLQ